eukprot:5278395-Pleurochrysis_carterae.AAC.4
MRPSVGDESPDSAEQAALLMGGPLEERNVLHFFEQARGSDVAINVDALVDGDMGVPQLAATKASASEAAVEGDRLNSMLPEDIATSMVSTMIRGAREQPPAVLRLAASPVSSRALYCRYAPANMSVPAARCAGPLLPAVPVPLTAYSFVACSALLGSSAFGEADAVVLTTAQQSS